MTKPQTPNERQAVLSEADAGKLDAVNGKGTRCLLLLFGLALESDCKPTDKLPCSFRRQKNSLDHEQQIQMGLLTDAAFEQFIPLAQPLFDTLFNNAISLGLSKTLRTDCSGKRSACT